MPKVNGVFAPLVNTTIQLPAQSHYIDYTIRSSISFNFGTFEFFLNGLNGN